MEFRNVGMKVRRTAWKDGGRDVEGIEGWKEGQRK